MEMICYVEGGRVWTRILEIDNDDLYEVGEKPFSDWACEIWSNALPDGGQRHLL